MRKTIMILGILVLMVAACGDNPPPTQIVIVISPTPDAGTPNTPGSTVTVEPTPSTVSTPLPTVDSQPVSQETRTPHQTAIPTATPRPAIFPTDVIAEVQLAEQVFEHGRMFWIRHTRQIWVMQAAADDPDGGDWLCFNDTFQEGEPEVDPSIIPEAGMYQPRRGFGELWRNHPEIRAALGWAITPEFELTSSYLYIAGGTVERNQYLPGPGEHRLTTLYKESVSFYESGVRGECQGGTWHMTPPQ